MIKKILKSLINKGGYTIYKNTENPYDPFNHMEKLFGNKKTIVIFDIGANFGQTVVRFKSSFQNSKIYAFEPHPEAYTNLCSCAAKYADVFTFEMALGNHSGLSNFYINTYSETSSLLEITQTSKEIWGIGAMTPLGSIQINVSTLDHFLMENPNISIDILKLDTQGTEFQILEGAIDALRQNKVKLIYTEIITLPTYKGQKQLHDLVELLSKSSFDLYGIYNHYYSSSKKLASVDAIFVHKSFIS